MSQNTRHPQTAFRHKDTFLKHLVKNVYYRISSMASGVAIAMAVQLCSKSKLILQKLSDRETFLSNRQRRLSQKTPQLLINLCLSFSS